MVRHARPLAEGAGIGGSLLFRIWTGHCEDLSETPVNIADALPATGGDEVD